MQGELRPGVLRELFTRLADEAEVKARIALEAVGLAIEKQAKINASAGSHRYGTPTPASRGSGPARISGTLVRSITHTPLIPTGFGWEMRVGLAGGLYPTYRSKRGGHTSKTPSSLYGMYLEKDLGYPFLGPAVTFGTSHVAAVVFREVFATWA